MYALAFFTLLVASSTASPALFKRVNAPLTGPVTGVATFNNYGTTVVAGQQPQVGQNCPNRDLTGGAQFVAAAGDLSPDISGGACPATQFNCVNGGPVASDGGAYAGPACPQNACGTCYNVTNMGGFNGDMTGAGNSVLVTIVDACPSNSGDNVCKTDPDPRDKCASSENALDIDLPAYQALTGVPYQSGVTPNLNIQITNC